jgi:hypothetical protein
MSVEDIAGLASLMTRRQMATPILDPERGHPADPRAPTMLARIAELNG